MLRPGISRRPVPPFTARIPAPLWTVAALTLGLILLRPARAEVVFQTYSPYHHVLVIDDRGLRTLSFDGTHETRMLLGNPLRGHFEYTELFHFAWLWHTNLSRVLMLGLGGGSTQRAFLHYYPSVTLESVELDPVVVQVASNYFGVAASDRHRIAVSDGRTYLKRSRGPYDLIVLDAYVKHRYGSQIPHHLATREFFELVRDRLSPDGVLAYNVITSGSLQGADAGSAVARTLLTAFPQVFAFNAASSRNTVLIATREPQRLSVNDLTRRAGALVGAGLNPPPGLFARLRALHAGLPSGTDRAPVLTDDFAPVESLGNRRP